MVSNIREILDKADEYLGRHEVESPRLDAEVLLADLLNTERIKLYVNYDYPLTSEQKSAYRKRLEKRAKGQPLSYITGKKEFMSLDFIIEPGVLIPRPETEELVEEILRFCRSRDWQSPRIVDLGTGSGAILVSLAHYLPESRGVGIDISSGAADVARRNVAKHDLQDRLAVLEGSWAEPLLPDKAGEVDLVVSNPPYIADEDMEDLPRHVREEPDRALAAGSDGLRSYRELIPQSAELLREGGLLALEIGHDQGEEILSLLSSDGFWQDVELKQDGGGRDRIIFARLKSEEREDREEERGE